MANNVPLTTAQWSNVFRIMERVKTERAEAAEILYILDLLRSRNESGKARYSKKLLNYADAVERMLDAGIFTVE